MQRETGHRARWGHRLLQAGALLFLLGLIGGFLVPATANPRMGLSSHLEGLMNGILLMVLGLVWPKLRLSERASGAASGLALFGTYTNWGTTLVAAFIGAGGSMMPIAAPNHTGSDLQELLIAIGLMALSVAMLAVGGMVLWGLRGGWQERS